jgi:hypothetical protein
MKTVSQTIYFDICADITDTINELTRVRDQAVEKGMIEGTGYFSIVSSDCNECMFQFSRSETEKERLRREKIEAAKAANEAAKAKAKDDSERAEYKRLKAKFEGAK